jgi:hypothetical protein
MGSYLHDIAARALGQSSTLQPRVPSLFEPPPALRSARLTPFPFLKADSESCMDSGDSTTPQQDWRSRSLSRRETPVASSDNQPGKSDSDKPGGDHADASRITGRNRRQAASTEPAALCADETEPVPSAPDSRAKPRIVPAVVTSTGQVRSDANEPPKGRDAGIVVARLRKNSPAMEPRSKATYRKEPDVTDSEPRASMRPGVRNVEAPERAEVAALSLRPAPRTPTFPRAEARNVEDTDGVFSVSVVIARVNVQAVLPQPTPVRLAHPSPAPLLSLEQYLRQRGGHS